MSHDGTGVGAAARDPAGTTPPPRSDAGGQERQREGEERAGAHDDVRSPRGCRRHCPRRGGLGLRKLGQRAAAAEGARVHGGGEAVRRADAADGDEDRVRRRVGQEELEAPHLDAAARSGRAVLAFQPQSLESERRSERWRGLKRRGPAAETAGRERVAYLTREPDGIRHCVPQPRANRCKSRPITSATPREPRASARAIPSAGRRSPPTPSSTRRWPKRWKRSPPASNSWAKKNRAWIATSARTPSWRPSSRSCVPVPSSRSTPKPPAFISTWTVCIWCSSPRAPARPSLIRSRSAT